jgi:hypothetical protein
MALFFAFARARTGERGRSKTMNADPDQQSPSPSRPMFRLLTPSDDRKPVMMEPKPAPDDDHPAEEPGYGHGV